jgi:hypothetical protein
MDPTEVPNTPRVVFDSGRAVDEAAAIRLRDRALVLLREHGEWSTNGEGHKLLCRETEHLVIAYEDPLQNSAVNLPHRLSVWSKSPCEKLFEIKWRDQRPVTLTAYKPGDWKAQLP